MLKLLHSIAMRSNALTKLFDCQIIAFDRNIIKCTLTIVFCENSLIKCFSRWNVKKLHSISKRSNALTKLKNIKIVVRNIETIKYIDEFVLLQNVRCKNNVIRDEMSKNCIRFQNDQMYWRILKISKLLYSTLKQLNTLTIVCWQKCWIQSLKKCSIQRWRFKTRRQKNKIRNADDCCLADSATENLIKRNEFDSYVITNQFLIDWWFSELMLCETDNKSVINETFLKNVDQQIVFRNECHNLIYA